MTESDLRDRDGRMRRMLRRLNVDVLELAYARAGALYGEARETCLDCQHTEHCRLWLQAGSTATPSFCPNLGRFKGIPAH